MERKEAIEVIKKNWPDSSFTMLREALETLIPELAESEDERIRKELIAHFKTNSVSESWSGLNVKKVIAWLEKQGEHANFRNKIQIDDKVTRNEDGVLVNLSQLKRIAKSTEEYNITGIGSKNAQGKLGEIIKNLKPVDNVKPKFKVGDWVMYCGKPYQITVLHNDTFTLTSCDGSYFFNNVKSTNEPVFHLWTIKDAKNGDVLAFNDGHGNDSIELIKSITDKKIEFWFCLSNGNYYEVFDGLIPYTNLVSREDATPATKEQRDILFQKMKEAGYELDGENKELKKIEQKPAWSEEDKKMFINIKACLRNANKDYSAELDWLKSLRPHNRWKPSEEQMNALKQAKTDACGKPYFNALALLYVNLKGYR